VLIVRGDSTFGSLYENENAVLLFSRKESNWKIFCPHETETPVKNIWFQVQFRSMRLFTSKGKTARGRRSTWKIFCPHEKDTLAKNIWFQEFVCRAQECV